MSTEPLFLPRRLAIRLLAEAQKSPNGEIHGLVGAKDQEPVSVHPASSGLDQAALRARGETLWAVYRSQPAAAMAPAGSSDDCARFLAVSLDTKGVLQLRCWKFEGGIPRERILKIRD